MQQSNQPARFLIPLAQNDTSRAAIPTTTADPARASQAAGFPPLTGQPPEAGGVPPQLPDMNGLLHMASRVGWWNIAGGRYAFDLAYATDVLIGGYPRAALIPAANPPVGTTGFGDWSSLVENNVTDPDTVGTGWAPGYHYGRTVLSALTGGTVTLTPAQAAKRIITLNGVLTSNLVVIVPGWDRQWDVVNNTSGSFTASVRTATGTGVLVPQNAAFTPILCDGTNCAAYAPNVGVATSPTQASQLSQGSGRLINVQVFTASGTYNPTAGASSLIVEMVGGGGGGAGAPATSGVQATAAGGGGGGAYVKVRIASAPSTAVTVGAAGAGGPATAPSSGGGGGASGFGAFATCSGGIGGTAANGSNTDVLVGAGGAGGAGVTVTGATTLVQSDGGGGTFGLIAPSSAGVIVGAGGNTLLGVNGQLSALTPSRANGGGGGAGSSSGPNGVGRVGVSGSAGLVIVYEYA